MRPAAARWPRPRRFATGRPRSRSTRLAVAETDHSAPPWLPSARPGARARGARSGGLVRPAASPPRRRAADAGAGAGAGAARPVARETSTRPALARSPRPRPRSHAPIVQCNLMMPSKRISRGYFISVLVSPCDSTTVLKEKKSKANHILIKVHCGEVRCAHPFRRDKAHEGARPTDSDSTPLRFSFSTAARRAGIADQRARRCAALRAARHTACACRGEGVGSDGRVGVVAGTRPPRAVGPIPGPRRPPGRGAPRTVARVVRRAAPVAQRRAVGDRWDRSSPPRLARWAGSARRWRCQEGALMGTRHRRRRRKKS